MYHTSMIWQSEEEILAFAQLLEDKSVEECSAAHRLESFYEHAGKGGYGQYLENAYFGLETNSFSRPDFYPVQLELKAASLIKNATTGLLQPKERLVLNIIDYEEVVNEKSFEASHFLDKNKALLIVWYIYNSSDHFGGYKVNLVDIWKLLDEDAEQICQDWNFIVQKIREGKAHELSEGDTLFLGACTKGADSSTLRKQPYSDIPAKQRAFCFKISYLRSVYSRMLARKAHRTVLPYQWFCKPGQTIEQAFKEKFRPYIGKSTIELRKVFDISKTSKNVNARIVRAIIGISDRSFAPYHDLMAGGVQLKIVRLEANGKNKESMSFPLINYKEIVNETWETSELYGILTSKFIVPVFSHDPDEPVGEDEYILNRICLWNMSEADLEKVHSVWEETRAKILEGDYSHFVKIRDKRIVHVRPHARNSKDTVETPQGTQELKKSFWLNASYIFSEIVSRPIIYNDFESNPESFAAE